MTRHRRRNQRVRTAGADGLGGSGGFRPRRRRVKSSLRRCCVMNRNMSPLLLLSASFLLPHAVAVSADNDDDAAADIAVLVIPLTKTTRQRHAVPRHCDDSNRIR